MILWYKNGDLVWSLDNKIVRGVIEFKFVRLVDWGFYYCVNFVLDCYFCIMILYFLF